MNLRGQPLEGGIFKMGYAIDPGNLVSKGYAN